MTRRDFAHLVAGMCACMPFVTLSACAGESGSSSSRAESTTDKPASASQSVATGPAQEGQPATRTIFVFDTVVSFSAYCPESVLDELEQRCFFFEATFSRTKETSDIGRINAAGGATVQVQPETADIVSKALEYCRESDGLFDITIGAVSTLWDFKEGIVPDDASIKAALSSINYTKVLVEGNSITLLDPGAKLDLGGIAKGYIADDLCRILTEAGCTSGYVNLGGNVKTVGAKPDGSPWNVGIQDPNGPAEAVVAKVESVGSSVVTSGLYERQFVLDGKRYWHILDPRTGYPVQADIVSASIISKESIDGDGYTKPLFMMSLEESLAWIDAHEGLEGLLMDENLAIYQTDGCNAEPLLPQ